MTQSPQPPPDRIEPHSPAELPLVQPPVEAPPASLPDVVPPAPDYDQPDRAPAEHPAA